MGDIEGSSLREVLPFILFLRTLFRFYQDRALDNICLFIIFKAPCPDKNQPKVFGKGGMGERTFPLYCVLNAVNYVLSPRRSSSEIFIMQT